MREDALKRFIREERLLSAWKHYGAYNLPEVTRVILGADVDGETIYYRGMAILSELDMDVASPERGKFIALGRAVRMYRIHQQMGFARVKNLCDSPVERDVIIELINDVVGLDPWVIGYGGKFYKAMGNVTPTEDERLAIEQARHERQAAQIKRNVTHTRAVGDTFHPTSPMQIARGPVELVIKNQFGRVGTVKLDAGMTLELA